MSTIDATAYANVLTVPFILTGTSIILYILGATNKKIRTWLNGREWEPNSILVQYILANRVLWYVKASMLLATAIILFGVYWIGLYSSVEVFFSNTLLLSGLILSFTGFCMTLVLPFLKATSLIGNIPDYAVLLSIFIYMAGQIFYLVGFGNIKGNRPKLE